MKIRLKLVLMILIALLSTVAISVNSILNAREDTEVFVDIRDTRIPKIMELDQLRYMQTDLVRRSYEIMAQNDFSYEEQLANLQRIQASLTRLVKEVPELIEKFGSRPIHSDGKPAWDSFVAAWGTWFSYDKVASETLDRALVSPSPEALNALYDQIRNGNKARQPQTTEIRQALEKLVDINDRLSEQAIADTIASSTSAMWQQIGLGIVAILVLSFTAWRTVVAIVPPLHRFGTLLVHVQNERDLTQRLNHKANDEIGEMGIAFDHTMETLQTAFGDIATQIEKVTSAVGSLAAAAEQVAQSSQSQSGSTSAMAASVEEMTVSVNTVSSSAADAQAMAREAGATSDEGSKIIEQTASEMGTIAQSVGDASRVIQELGEASKEISNVVAVIKEVADQTNLLALNAAIEAARAGEQGRGFAVVADEVRKLAERTAQSTGDISAMIGKIQASANEAVTEMGNVVQQVESGQSLAQEAGKRIQKIRDDAIRVSDAVTEISGALKEQSEASTDIAKHVESIAQMTDENNAAAEETASNARHLDDLAKSVQKTIGQFRV
ncbi:MAG: methyl-accepting chemotaxis protein [Zoogloeaceae bacterium]|jgi:methyl-accepting chemotaxis protein|nr:methyl-accepting chemotaxis protein [Zoogloeaceae bacterium]